MSRMLIRVLLIAQGVMTGIRKDSGDVVASVRIYRRRPHYGRKAQLRGPETSIEKLGFVEGCNINRLLVLGEWLPEEPDRVFAS